MNAFCMAPAPGLTMNRPHQTPYQPPCYPLAVGLHSHDQRNGEAIVPAGIRMPRVLEAMSGPLAMASLGPEKPFTGLVVPPGPGSHPSMMMTKPGRARSPLARAPSLLLRAASRISSLPLLSSLPSAPGAQKVKRRGCVSACRARTHRTPHAHHAPHTAHLFGEGEPFRCSSEPFQMTEPATLHVA